MNYDNSLKVVDVSWTNWKTCAARPNTTTYYVQYSSTYEAIAIDYHFIYRSILNLATNITEFATSYKSAATAVLSVTDAVGLANKNEILNVQNLDAARNPLAVQKGTAVPSTQGLLPVGGWDGTNALLLKTLSTGVLVNSPQDASGNSSVVTKDSAVPATPGVTLLGVSDGANIRLLAGDSSGRVKTANFDGSGNALNSTNNALNVSLRDSSGTAVTLNAGGNLKNTLYDAAGNVAVGTKGSAFPATAGVAIVGGTDGTNTQAIATDTSGRVKTTNFDGAGNALTSTSGKLDVGLTGANTVKLNDSAGTAITLSGANLKTSLFDASANAAIITKGSAVPATPGVVLVGGSDGTNAQFVTVLAKDTVLPVTTNVLMAGASDGTTARALSSPLDAAANPANLRGLLVSGTDGSNTRVLRTNTSGQTICESHTFDGSANSISSIAPGTAGVRSLDVVQRGGSSLDINELIVVTNQTTTTTTTANQILSTRTVAAGKTFYLVSYYVAIADHTNAVDGGPITLNINGAVWRQTYLKDQGGGNVGGSMEFKEDFCQGLPVATAGQVVKLTVTPSAALSKLWSSQIIGFER